MEKGPVGGGELTGVGKDSRDGAGSHHNALYKCVNLPENKLTRSNLTRSTL